MGLKIEDENYASLRPSIIGPLGDPWAQMGLLSLESAELSIACAKTLLFKSRVSYRIFGWRGGLFVHQQVQDWGYSSPRKKLRFGLTIDFSISTDLGGGGGDPSFPPPCMKP